MARVDQFNQPHSSEYPADSLILDRMMASASLWLVIGLFLDGWAHNSLGDSIETFFTPWHAVLYSGLGVAAAVPGIMWLRNLGRGYRWDRALPQEYMLSLLGVFIFGVAGGLDFAWHSTFGFEIDTEALLSPPHLLLASGGLFIITGPMRTAWHKYDKEPASWIKLWPALVSAFATLSVFAFFTQFSNQFQHANSFVGSGPTNDLYFFQVSTLSFILIPAVIVMGFVLLLIRRWELPVGTLLVFIAGNAVLMFLMGNSYSGQYWPVLLAALAGGIVAELLYHSLRTSHEDVWKHRLFAFATPFVLNLLYLGALIATSGIWWRIHMWLGAPILSGAIGLGLSFLVLPSRTPEGQQQE